MRRGQCPAAPRVTARRHGGKRSTVAPTGAYAARVAFVTVFAVCAGCRPTSEEMAWQGRMQRYEPSSAFAGATSARHLAPGVVPRVAQHDAHAPRLEETAPALALTGGDLLARGRERYGIWCTPCHAVTGLGDGPVVARGYPAPPSFTEPRLLAASDAHFYRVLRDGLGKMPPYGPHVAPADRHAILAWIRVLQRSQHARLEDAPAGVQERLRTAREEEGR